MTTVFDESNDLAKELLALIDVRLFDDSLRIRTSDIACSLGDFVIEKGELFNSIEAKSKRRG